MEHFTVEQIAEKRGVSKQAIYKQIKSHQEELKGHKIKNEGKTWYDEEAVEILEKASSQSPVVYVENKEKERIEELEAEIKELRQELDADRKAMRTSQELINKLMEQNLSLGEEKAKKELYLEQKEKAESELSELRTEKDKEIKELQAQLQEERSKTWWQKLRGR